MASSNTALNIVIRAKDLAKGALTKVTARLRRMGKASQQTENRFASLGRSIRNLVVASLGFYAIKKAMQGVLQTGDQFERLNVQMKAIMGSIEEGERAVEWVKQFTKDTPLQLEQVAEAFVTLKNFGLDPMDGTLQAIVDQNSKLGGGFERLSRISLALGQAWGKQKLQGEELRQLIEAGVPVWDLLAKATGKNVTELRKLSEQGKLGTDVVKGLIAEIGKSSVGAAADNMRLLSGLTSNMADRWTEFKDAVAQAGWLSYVKEQLTDLSSKLDTMASNGKLQALAKSISDGFVAMAESVKAALVNVSFEEFVASVRSSFTTISSLITSLKSGLTTAANAASIFFNGFAAGVKLYGAVVSAQFFLITKGLQKLNEAFGNDEAAKRFKGYADFMKQTSKAFVKEVIIDTKQIGDSWKKIYDNLAGNSQKANQTAQTHNKKTIDELLQNYPKVEVAAKKTGDTAKKAFADAADALKKINAAETTTELADLGVALSLAFNDGILTQEQYTEALEASKTKLKELREEADAAGNAATGMGKAAERAGQQQASAGEQAESIAGAMAGHYNAITTELNGMSGAAQDAFQNMQGVGNVDTSNSQGHIANLKNELEETRQKAHELNTAFSYDITGIDDWMRDTASDAANVKTQFLEQKIALEELLDSYQKGEVDAGGFVNAGREAAETMELLDQQDLDRLNSAIRIRPTPACRA